MSDLTLMGINGRSLGDLLKGYGVIGTVGSAYPEIAFWWNSDTHLVVSCDSSSEEQIQEHVIDTIVAGLPAWAQEIGLKFQKQRANKEKGIKGGATPLQQAVDHDGFDAEIAKFAAVVAVFPGGGVRSHPLFPGLGQDGSANYFTTLQAEAAKLAKSGGQASQNGESDLEISLFGRRDAEPAKRLSATGGVYFPGAIKRYATGSSWVHEKDAPISGWDFLLAIRGALLLRGAARRFRGSRRSYPSFPFVFLGSPVKAGGQVFVTDEVFLPTWSADKPRTLAEFELQIRQFQARVGGGELASSAAEFRRAVQGRGVAGGFDRFHRFVLERRKPGQQRPAVQAVARGVTTVGAGAKELRVLLARVDEFGWLDQLEQPTVRADRRDERLLFAARQIHDAVHACADHPTPERHLAILSAFWEANRLLLDRTERTRNQGESGRIRTLPLPPFPAAGWERVLGNGFFASPEARIARALASIGWNGWDRQKHRWAPGTPWPPGTQLLSIEYLAGSHVLCRIPEQKLADRVRWRGFHPERDFAELLRRRWLDALSRDDHDRLPFVATRTAPLADVLDLLRGRLNVTDIQRLCSALLVLDWSRGDAPTAISRPMRAPTSAAYAILRLWLDAGINPPRDRRASWDGAIAQAISRGDPASIRSACRLALARLRITGLPGRSPSEERRGGKAVAAPEPQCTGDEARLMALAVLIPIGTQDTDRLADRLRVPAKEEAAYG